MRPQGKVKIGFYPTPPPVVKAIARFMAAMSTNARFRLLDPCAGDGKALALLQQSLKEQHARENGKWTDFNAETYGIEIQSLLAPQAEERLGHVLETSFFTTTLSHGDTGDRGWQCIYLNPPYDDDLNASKGERKEREEFKFLKRATLLLSAYGILVFIVPQYVLQRPGVARFLAQHYDQHSCFRFPDESWRPAGHTTDVAMYEQFKQVVFFGRKRPKALPYSSEDAELNRQQVQIEQWVNMSNRITPISLEGNPTGIQYAIPNAPDVDLKYFVKGSFSPDAAAKEMGQFSSKTKRPQKGVWASEEYWSARFPDPHRVGLSVGHPLHKFKRGYLIVFAVAGLLNRAILTGREGRRILVKGHTRKTLHYSCQDSEWEKVEKNTERYESSLWCTDLVTSELILVQTGGGTTVEWDLEYEAMSMQEFLEEFGDSIMQQVLQFNAPRYQSAHQIPWAKQGFSRILRKPLNKQLDIILAQVHAYVNRWHEGGIEDEELVSRIAEIAEMASGKTYMAICTAFLADLYACGAVELATNVTKKLAFFPAVILTPPIMAPKWKREIEQTIPNARVLIIERFSSLHDLDDDDEEEDDERLSARPSKKKSFSDASQAFRQFDPDFQGTGLGIVGSVDRAVVRISEDLALWQHDYKEAEVHNQAIREGTSTGELKPLPLKPCHVIILTFNTARSMPQWMPVYRMKPMRYRDPESEKIKLAKRHDGSLAMVPCCPSCGRAIKDEKRAMREPPSEQISERDTRSKDGLRLAQKLAAYDERIEEYLTQNHEYHQLDEERNTLRQRIAKTDALWLWGEECIADFRAKDPEYLSLVAARDKTTNDEDRAEGDMRITERLDHHLLYSADYRALVIQQDKRIEDLLYTCEKRMKEIREHLARTDEGYRQLLADRELIREAFVRQPRRLSTFEEEANESVSLYLTEAELIGTKDHRVKRNCVECGEPLWQYVPKKPKVWEPFSVLNFLPAKRELRIGKKSVLTLCTGSEHTKPLPLPDRGFYPTCVKTTYGRRWAIADYIADQYPNFFKFLIADETHEGADGTALDQARQLLTSACCGRMIGLTGTLSNGYASSLFRLFYVIMRQVRQRYQYDATMQWIADHGKMQTVQKSKYEEAPTGTGSDSKRKIKPGMPVHREIAGFDPTGMGLVAQRSTFTELKDVVPNLVGYTEKVKFVDMGKQLGQAYMTFEQHATLELGSLLAKGDNSGLSPWYNALLIYPDMPWLGWICQTKRGSLLGIAPALPEDVVYPIERALIDYVQEQQNNGFPVLVYTENSGQYDDQDRLKYLFETKVRGRGGRRLKVAVLRSNTTKKTMDREAWLSRCVEDGIDVLICNPALVKVGLDLIYFKRIAYKRTPRKVSDLRQSSRRSLRPGQDTDIEVVFFAYKESMALRLLHLMARKAQASLLVEGKIATEGLVSLGFDEEEDEGDIMGRMARDMVEALKSGTLVDSAKMAEELQELTRQSIEIERKQNQDVGEEEDLEVRAVLEEIRTSHVTASANYYEDVTAPSDAVQEAPPAEPIEVMTVPVSVTEDPWASAIAVQAELDVWAALRQQLGPRKRGGRRR